MTYGRRFIARLLNFLRPDRAERDLAREIASHLTLLEDDFKRRGMNADEAHFAAKRAYGSVDQTKELHRDERSFVWLEQVRQDFQFSARILIRNPGFTITAVLTLALGIGANSAIFSIVNAVLLKPLPYRDSDRLIRIVENVPADESFTGKPFRLPAMSPEDASRLSRSAKSLSQVALYLPGTMVLTEATESAVVQVAQLSPRMLPMLGVQPLLGRMFNGNEDKTGADRVVLLSHGAWVKYFGANPRVLNRAVVLDGIRHSVIGVMPDIFQFPDSRTEFWKPLVVTASPPGKLSVFPVLARINPKFSQAAASTEVNQIFRHLRGEARASQTQQPGPPRMELTTIKNAQAAVSRPALLVLGIAVGLVLLIACANVASLLLARNTSRQRETAIRASLGAGRGRLMRQSLVESIMLGMFGGVAGFLLAMGADQLLVAQWPGNINAGEALPRLDHIALDSSVFAFTFASALLTGLLFGLAPAFRISKTDYVVIIKQGAVFTSSALNPLRGYRALRALVIAETAMAFVLLIGAGLLIRSFLKLSSIDPGFSTNGVLTFQVDSAPGAGRNAFNAELAERLKAIPGVQAAGYGELLPLELQSMLIRPFKVPGVPQTRTSLAVQPRTLEGSWDYFRAVGLRLVAGRWFQKGDGPGRPPVMLVNRALAHQYFGNENPIGKTVISLGSTPWEIVGLVEDVRQRGLTSEPEPQFFLEYRQMLHALPEWANGDTGRAYSTRMYFAIRTSGDPLQLAASVRQIVSHLDKDAAMNNTYRLDDVVSDSIVAPGFYAALLGIFSLLAIVLAAIGIYGVIAYAVTQRTREIGIRMALGARRKEVLLLVMGQGVRLAGIGILLGIASASVVTRYLQQMLFGLTPLDPQTFVAVSVTFAVVAGLASYLPARRATKVDPAISLRYE